MKQNKKKPLRAQVDHVKSSNCDDAIRQYYRDKIKELKKEGAVGILLPVNKDSAHILKEELNEKRMEK